LRCTGEQPPTLFDIHVARRLNHEPIAYIIGAQEFYGRALAVTPAVLIPRADSETTLAAALEASRDPRRILDCGTGSGALLLSLLAERPLAVGIGIDRSLEALAVAAGNAERFGLADRAEMRPADWLTEAWAGGLGRFDLVIANPPYVETGAELDPSVREFEPAGALFAGPDGLDDYRVLVPQLPALLEPGGVAVLEIGTSQAVSQIAADVGFGSELRRDLGGRPRALVLRKTHD
jgi:release factor glutamine methyltransferase